MIKQVRLGDVCDVNMGQAPEGSSYNDQARGLPLLAGAGDFGEISPTPTKFTTQPTKLAQPGDIILCIRATIGDLNWADQTYCLGRGVAGLRPRNGCLDPKYLWHWFGLNALQLAKLGKGSTFKQVTRADIEGLQLNLPSSLKEQRRIAAILDKADAIRRKRRQVLAEIDALLRATFLDMFGDPATNPHGLPLEPMREFGRVVTGNTPPRGNSEYFGSQIEWIKSDNISEAKYFLTRAAEGLSETGRSVGRVAPSGSILVTCIAGSPKSIGTERSRSRRTLFRGGA